MAAGIVSEAVSSEPPCLLPLITPGLPRAEVSVQIDVTFKEVEKEKHMKNGGRECGFTLGGRVVGEADSQAVGRAYLHSARAAWGGIQRAETISSVPVLPVVSDSL